MIKIMKYGEISEDEIFARVTPQFDVSGIVSGILADVKANGDKALLSYTEKFDGAKLDSLAVTKEEIDEALGLVEPEFLKILKTAAENITKFHKMQVREPFVIDEGNGVIMGQKITPVDAAGLYVPGGTAA